MSSEPQNNTPKEQALEDVMKTVYTIDRDCNDEKLIENTIEKLNQVIDMYKGRTKEDISLRNDLLDHMYDLYEFLNFYDKRSRFEVMKRMVKNIKENDGSFDHNPLNITFRRMNYSFGSIPADERYKLALEIKRKTQNTTAYNYDEPIKKIGWEYAAWKREQKYLRRENSIEKYEEIRKLLHDKPDNLKQIELYNALLPLINDQNWSRGRKFAEKKTIYNHLADLYDAEGMKLEAYNADVMCEKFRKALSNNKKAAVLLGYKNSKGRD